MKIMMDPSIFCSLVFPSSLLTQAVWSPLHWNLYSCCPHQGNRWRLNYLPRLPLSLRENMDTSRRHIFHCKINKIVLVASINVSYPLMFWSDQRSLQDVWGHVSVTSRHCTEDWFWQCCVSLVSCCAAALGFGTQRRNNGPKTLFSPCSPKPTVVPALKDCLNKPPLLCISTTQDLGSIS